MNEERKEEEKINRALLKGVIVCVCKQEKKCQKEISRQNFCDAYTKDKTIKLEKKEFNQLFKKFHHYL